MRIPRCFVHQPLHVGDAVDLPAPACEHLLRVLRLAQGAPLILCNGDGMDYHAQLAQIDRRGARARIERAQANLAESPLRIVLVQALARGEKMDWVVQKATELGVAAIAPVITERTEVRLDAERAQRRLAHWQGVALAACEQSGRASIPEIAAPIALAHHLGGLTDDGLRLVLDPEGQAITGLLAEHAPDGIRTLRIVIGPEGGLSERDLAQLRAAHFVGWRLGPRILRTETAGLAALAVLQALAGDGAK